MGSNRFLSNSNSNSNSPDPLSLQGKLLVASPQLTDSRFERAVVLLMQHDERGSFGVALNKPAGDKVKTAWQKLTGTESTDERTIVAGGPLKGPVFAIHQMPSLGDAEMPGGLYVSAQVNKLQQLMLQFEKPYRIVVGIAGWKQGQLLAELESGCWYLLPADAETVFDDPEWMWETCLQECGRQQIADILGYDDFPDDPSIN